MLDDLDEDVTLPEIVIADYDPRWPALFEAERDAIVAALGEAMAGVAGIEHIGSTSVPGCAAKPIIDIMIGVGALEEAKHLAKLLREVGYITSRSRSPTTRMSFEKAEPGAYHVHLVQQGHEEWQRLIAFRDHLREHIQEARRYGALKRELARRHRDEPFAYSEGKAPFINVVLKRAEAGSTGA